MTDGDLAAIAGEVQQLVTSVPKEMAVTLAATIRQMDTANWPYARAVVARTFPQPAYQPQIGRLLDAWQVKAPGLLPQGVALAILTAAYTADHFRGRETIDLVWTGPDSKVISLRRTDQALL